MSVINLVTTVVVNYQTPDLIDSAVRTFRRRNPHIRVLVIDNGSKDESAQVINRLAEDLGESVTPLFLSENRHHGPAMHLAVQGVDTPFIFYLDSDTETLRGGFLEEMTVLCEPPNVYGAGKIVHVNRRGFSAKSGIPVLASAFMLIKRDVYRTLPPFIHHGLPALNNFRGAQRKGYELAAYPIEEYVKHFGRGTAERFGYGLGWRSRIDYVLNRLGL